MFIIQHLAWIPKIFEAELEELMGAAKEIAKVVANDLWSHTLSVFAVYVQTLYYVVYFKLLRYYFQADNTDKSLAEKYDRMKLCLLLVSQH